MIERDRGKIEMGHAALFHIGAEYADSESWESGWYTSWLVSSFYSTSWSSIGRNLDSGSSQSWEASWGNSWLGEIGGFGDSWADKIAKRALEDRELRERR
jgi:hypothetical protein